jgi:putative serine protease PepD
MTAGYGDPTPGIPGPPASHPPTIPIPQAPPSAWGPPQPPQVSAPPATPSWDPYPQRPTYDAPVRVKRTRSWPGVVALVFVVLLMLIAGGEGYWIYQLQQRLTDANERVDAGQAADQGRMDGLDRRTNDLERELGKAFDSAAIAAATLPSVFRVVAGDFSGTAFAVGKPTSGGGTNLFTNFHVVKQVYERGDREVSIERRDQRFPARIAKVDTEQDLALLESEQKFTALVAATEKVKSGEPIVVVGAPLGLEDSVTTGVVSAFRKLPDWPGEMMQFDAAINPGNSGGPVINSQKQVVGIATAKARETEGIGLAVPIATACAALGVC